MQGQESQEEETGPAQGKGGAGAGHGCTLGALYQPLPPPTGLAPVTPSSQQLITCRASHEGQVSRQPLSQLCHTTHNDASDHSQIIKLGRCVCLVDTFRLNLKWCKVVVFKSSPYSLSHLHCLVPAWHNGYSVSPVSIVRRGEATERREPASRRECMVPGLRPHCYCCTTHRLSEDTSPRRLGTGAGGLQHTVPHHALQMNGQTARQLWLSGQTSQQEVVGRPWSGVLHV